MSGLRWGLPSGHVLELLAGSGAAGRDVVLSADPLALAGGEAADGARSADAYTQPHLVAASAGGAVPEDHIRRQMRGYLLQSRTFDEGKTFNAIAALDPRKFEPSSYLYGGAYLYGVASALVLADLADIATLVGGKTHYLRNPDDMERLYLVARVLSALAAVVLVGLCAWVAGSFGLPAAVVAALLVCTSPELLFASHIAKPHALSALGAFATVAVFIAARLRRPVVLGIVSGLTVAASITYGILALPVFFYAVYQREYRALRTIALSAGVVFCLSNFHVLLAPMTFIDSLTHHYDTYGYGDVSRNGVLALGRELGTLGVGAGALVLAAFGAPTGLRAQQWAYWVLGAILTFGLLVSVLRISLVLVPMTAVLAGIGAARLAALIARDRRWAAVAVVVVVLQAPTVQAFVGLWTTFRNDSDPARSPALVAGRWINENVPSGSRVGIQLSDSWNDNVPPFDFLEHELLAHDDLRSEYLVVASKCDQMLQPTLEKHLARGYVVRAQFSACSLTLACNCRYQAGLSTAVLQRADRTASLR